MLGMRLMHIAMGLACGEGCLSDGARQHDVKHRSKRNSKPFALI